MNEYGTMLLLIAKEGDMLNKVTHTGYPNLHPPHGNIEFPPSLLPHCQPKGRFARGDDLLADRSVKDGLHG